VGAALIPHGLSGRGPPTQARSMACLTWPAQPSLLSLMVCTDRIDACLPCPPLGGLPVRPPELAHPLTLSSCALDACLHRLPRLCSTSLASAPPHPPSPVCSPQQPFPPHTHTAVLPHPCNLLSSIGPRCEMCGLGLGFLVTGCTEAEAALVRAPMEFTP